MLAALLVALTLCAGPKAAAADKSPPEPKPQNAQSTATTKSAAGTKHVATFDDSGRPDNWSVNFGHWEPHQGVLVARELEKDEHPAASRWRIPLADGTVRLKLKFAGAKGFHLGFDPAPGQLKKQGHLYSLVISPGLAVLKKHRDKADDASKDETLATCQSSSLVADVWLPVELRAEGDQVSVKIGTIVSMQATDPSFHVAKPGVVFRVLGGDVQLDDVELTVTKEAPVAKPAAAP